MHMADALISPAVGCTMWAASAALTAYSAGKLTKDVDDGHVPFMGVLGAFIFAAQMINFSIPGTGSSGHLGGGMILAILLGPHAAFLTMTSILTVQALFFADGGLLALGCNLFNLGFFPCFVIYPLIFRKIAGERPNERRILAGSFIAAITGLQMGAFGVVLETHFSNISELPFVPFLLLMQPIHLAIGVMEGLVTAAVVTFVWKARPEILAMSKAAGFDPRPQLPLGKVLAGFLGVAVLTAGLLSWFASSDPDGLEWSISHTSGMEELSAPEKGVYSLLASLQEKTAFFPNYGFKKSVNEDSVTPNAEEARGESAKKQGRPAVSAETSVSGLVGGVMTLVLAGFLGFGLKRYQTGKK